MPIPSWAKLGTRGQGPPSPPCRASFPEPGARFSFVPRTDGHKAVPYTSLIRKAGDQSRNADNPHGLRKSLGLFCQCLRAALQREGCLDGCKRLTDAVDLVRRVRGADTASEQTPAIWGCGWQNHVHVHILTKKTVPEGDRVFCLSESNRNDRAGFRT